MAAKTPSLSQYFGSEVKINSSFSAELAEASKRVSNLRIDESGNKERNEPEVCRIFSEVPVQSKDHTAAFFDLIGNPSTSSTVRGGLNDLGFSTDVGIQLFYISVKCLCLCIE